MKKLYISLIGLLLLSANTANSQCAYDNTYWETKAAPTVIGDSVITYLFGGEFSTITGMQAGNVYQISTCGDGVFDSQITIYEAGGTFLEAFNDDYAVCVPQSRTYFSPFTSGSYDILIDEYNCIDNFSDAITVTVKLYDTPTPIIEIPTVVHVVYNNGTENITDAQIQTQIDVLNEDFRRLNTDVFSAPSRFRGFSKDIRVEFCLATRDEFGSATTGITRTYTDSTSFAGIDNEKFNTTGGKDIWNRDEYLNLWVCNLSGGTLGYAQFPGGAASTDGVVINYTAFGTIGTATSPYDLGRTASHEVGHWLDLYHIWGDDGNLCTGSDLVNDTPNQADESAGCPAAPTSCSNGGLGGDMYVDYMDYSDDLCLTMFTYWQYRRMEAALYGPRVSLQSSIGCQPPIGINESVAAANVSIYPNPVSTVATVSINLPNEQLSDISFTLFDILGQKIKAIDNIQLNQFELSTSDIHPGVYLYKLSRGSNTLASGNLVIIN